MLRHLIPLAVILAMPGADARLQPQPGQPPAPVAVTPAQPAAPAAQPADPLAAAPRISPTDARKALAAGLAVLVDVRGTEAYQAEHAKGSINIPANELYARTGELPKGKQIITYCT